MARSSHESPFLVAEEVARRLRSPVRTIHEMTRTAQIPHLKLGGSRRCLFSKGELEKWEAAARLELIALPRGGRVVRAQPELAAATADERPSRVDKAFIGRRWRRVASLGDRGRPIQ